MSENNVVHEQLSALVDDELASAEQTLLLHRLLQEAELRDKLVRYQLIRDTITQRLPTAVDTNFSHRVAVQIAAEPALVACAAKRDMSRILKPLSGAAIAASVAIFSIMGVRQLWQNMALNHSTVDSHLSAAPAKRHGMRWDLNQHEIENRLNSYMVNHNETTSGTNLNGIMQYFRIVGYDMDDNSRHVPTASRIAK